MMNKIILICCLILAPLLTMVAQNLVPAFTFSSPEYPLLTEVQKITIKQYKGLPDVRQALSELTADYHKAGYFLAGTDSVKVSGDTCHIWFYQGPKSGNCFISFRQDEYPLLQLAGFVPEDFYATKASVPSSLQKIVYSLNEKGYPMARVRVREVSDSNGHCRFIAEIESGRYYHWDSIDIRGDVEISNKVLQKLLHIRKGQPYSRVPLMQAGEAISALSWLKTEGSISVILTDSGLVRLILPASKVKASGFQGVIGFGPKNDDQSKISLTGDVRLKLVNSLRLAEEMELNWLGNQGDQTLKIQYRQPYIPFLPFGISFYLDFLKKGELYYRLEQRYGFLIPFNPGNELVLYLRKQDSRVLDRDIFKQITVLPAWTDFTAKSYGMEYHILKLDLPVNPSRGVIMKGDISGGRKDLILSADIPENLIAEAGNSQMQYRVDVRFEAFLPISKRWVFHPGSSFKTIYSQVLHENELFLLGGNGTIRGIAENSIPASSAVLLTGEIRYRFEQEGHLRIFVDGGWFEKRLQHTYLNDHPLGFGAGVAFRTAAGILQLDYAFAIRDDSPFDLRTGRLHLGILSVF
jgi:outer membrane protein assembly factor BamA